MNIGKKIFFYALFLSLVSLLWGCKPKVEPIKEKTAENVVYPISIISDEIVTKLNDQTVLYPVSDEFLEDFLAIANNYMGQHLTISARLPEQWGVVCVERLPEGRELYLLQSENREWIYLVITSGFGTQRILDALPVAVNLASQVDDSLEKEYWSTNRESDGAFVVLKKYEWVRSVAEATREEYEQDPASFTRAFEYINTYYINELSRFEYIETDTVPEYSAVIFYYKPELKPEEWDDYIPIIQSYCEENEIIFDEIYQDFDQVVIRDYNLNTITELDLTPYISATGSGMIMLKKGVEPKSEIFGSYDRMKIEIKRYYKIISQ